MTNYAAALAAQFHLKEQQTAKLIELIDAGNTIPFIARYRKEEHGSLDDQTIRTVYERLQYLRNLDTRKAEVRELIEGTGNLTPEIEKSLTNAATLAEIDDIYRPFRPKRKTRAGMAKERGLEPLAKKILAQEKGVDPMRLAEGYVNAEKGVNTSEDALNGAKDIIAETISDDAVMRRRLRMAAMAQGVITSRAAKDEDSVYRMYYEFSQPAAKIAGHRVLALDRGEREGPEQLFRREGLFPVFGPRPYVEWDSGRQQDYRGEQVFDPRGVDEPQRVQRAHAPAQGGGARADLQARHDRPQLLLLGNLEEVHRARQVCRQHHHPRYAKHGVPRIVGEEHEQHGQLHELSLIHI